ncbi:glucose-1-phosphate adenylyltransferase [Tichowtungia aerotolerans]|uniref:Glucose-1-phosphate adenylyltransferase n=1 Tax=Tichowtungia aerotolerans TaxID=2697043 RepID=A0A6P1MCH4_9BACT|nr:glucose-1-phosphate adenylyltransferase [Tichowtungia aerotolerans]QHI70813.1 glucose-1-phosphate adenylyltransferase [Tichowtungia aerotolerans]
MNTVGLILGGGAGTRLQPLTKDRAKPAVPIAGKYRLVDIPISNCINSGIRSIYLLTQFNSVSLHRHIQSTYLFDQFSRGAVRMLAAEQTPESEGWFQGTADAVRQSMKYFMHNEPDFVVILSGDQLYRMDFSKVIEEHIERGADVTICTKPVSRNEAGSLGIMHVDETNKIVKFAEKPGDGPELDDLRAPMFEDECYLASMGIYVFNADVLKELLCSNDDSDFGKHIIPAAISERKVFSHNFEGYWKDIGTIGMFHEANLALTDLIPEFTFYDAEAPVYTHMRYLPPSKINCCDLNRCLLSDGCIISGHRILHSVVGTRAVIGEGTVIEHSVIMGADYYEQEKSLKKPTPGVPSLGIGKDCYIKNAIIDKNVHIGDSVYISPDGKVDGEKTDTYVVRDGVIVIPKKTIIPSGTRL